MGGERDPVQPGGRPPAPGRLALVQAFINSHYDLEHDHGAELFDSPAALVRWLAERELIDPGARVDAKGLERALTIRESLRALAAANPGDQPPRAVLERLDTAAAGARAEVRFTGGASFIPGERAGLDEALGALLATVAAATIDGSWSRLKVCPGEDCGWAFFDHSRNQTGRWCSMRVCGGRAKARAHYRRRRGAV